MAVLDASGFAYALHTLYDQGKLYKATYEDNVAYARLPKDTNFKGKNFAYPVRYADLTSRSQTFSTAKTNRNTSLGVEFTLTRKHDYAVGAIDTETVLASEGDPAAAMAAVEAEADSAVNAMKRSIGIRLFGNGSGKIGAVGNSPGASPTCTLKNADDITHFEVGMVVVFAANESSALRTDAPAKFTVVAVNRDAGTWTANGNLNTISDLAQYDSIFAEGDYVSASDRNMIMGFAGWIPASADTLFGVDRTVDRSRLCGVYYNDTSYPGYTTKEAIQLVVSRIKRQGQLPDTCYMGADRFRGLINELDSQVSYIKETIIAKDKDGEAIAEVGFDGINVHCGGAVVKCFADPNCPENDLYVLKNDSWEFKTLGPAPRWITKGHIDDTADAMEFRLAYWGNLRCKNPSANGRFYWA